MDSIEQPLRKPLADSHPILQLIVLVALAIGLGLFFTMIGFLFAVVLSGVEISVLMDEGAIQELMRSPTFLRITQFFSSLGAFVLPAFIFARLISYKPFEELALSKKSAFIPSVITVGAVLSLLPFIDGITYLNEQISLPEYFSAWEVSLRDAQEAARTTIGLIVQMDSFGAFLANLLVMALLPAVGEELIFRGAVQPLFFRWFKNSHAAIWLTAFLFGIMHGQIYVLAGLTILGAVFGYMRHWSGSIWLPMTAHFINNGAIVVGYYFFDFEDDVVNTGTPTAWWAMGLSLIAGIVLLAIAKKMFSRTKGQVEIEA